LIRNESKDDFYLSCEKLPSEVKFNEYSFNFDQMTHLRYRCEDIFHSISKNDIKKAKTKKISQELLHSRKMESYFKDHPEEKNMVIKTIQDCNVNVDRPSVTYLPAYLIHDEGKKGTIEEVINKKYEKPLNDKKRKKRPSKMEKYFIQLDNEKAEKAEKERLKTEEGPKLLAEAGAGPEIKAEANK